MTNKNLFLQQSYLDSLDTYRKSLEGGIPVWDYVILTASNEAQARAYTNQIEYRKKNGRLPSQTQFAVIPDPDGKRVGSGGATLNVLKYIKKHSGKSTFEGMKILVLHSGGDAKRTPQYSACGKIFSPVPRLIDGGVRSSLFDEFLIGLSGVPSRMTDGMLVCSGDVLLLFNCLQLDPGSGDAIALSIKENVETGKDHGVFLGDENGFVKSFLHKQTVEKLNELGAVDKKGSVDLDTGAVIFCGKILDDLYSLSDTDEKFAGLVNEHVRLSFYADFLYPLAGESTLEKFYKETPEGDFSPELDEARRLLWDKLHNYRLKLIRFSPASFLHFGTTKELLSLETCDMPSYSFLGWSGNINSNRHSDNFAVSNSYISKGAIIGDGSYIEDSYLHGGTVIGKGCVISGVTLENVTVPENTVLHGLKLQDGRFAVRMYAVSDNPKEKSHMGKKLSQPLWTCPLFPVRTTMAEAVKATLDGEAGELTSLRDSFNNADVTAILPWQEKLLDKIKVETLCQAIDDGVCVSDAVKLFGGNVSQRAEKLLLDMADGLDGESLTDFSKKIRIYYYLSKISDTRGLSDKCFDAIRDTILQSNAAIYNKNLRIAENEVVTQLPVRVNWGGGWTDTPPYCMEHGGTVLNAAITLDGKKPIEVTVRRQDKNSIVLASTDIGVVREFDDINELCDCRNPSDPFSLHKASLLACGVIGADACESVEQVCRRIGGGLYMNTRVVNIPKGSGLGTSSILAGACVKGLYDFFGCDIGENELYNRVLCMEQIMSTGGGWQDQVGGLATGIKMVSSARGLHQDILCTPVHMEKEALAELDERFAVIYTGQRRLARNLLREVVGKYVGNDKNSLDVHYRIQQLAVLMRFELEKGNIDGFAKLLSEHWELSKKMDAGCTNTCIDCIFTSIDDLIDGKMICGAGGGGFLQVVLKKGVKPCDLQARLDEVFADSGVGVWDARVML